MQDLPLTFARFTIGVPKDLAIHLFSHKKKYKTTIKRSKKKKPKYLKTFLQKNVLSYSQQVIKGGIIIFAVLLQRFENK